MLRRRALGTALPWLLFMAGVHTVWSISVPIAIMETPAGSRRTTPWLGERALWAVAVLTYAWHSFPWKPFEPASLSPEYASIEPTSPALDLTGNAILTAGAIVLLVIAALWRAPLCPEQLRP
ncbi:hypothetical protein Misp01_82200 [Microtetraspora sp. NBRC 13810]|uniref:hypothetical protein n=1 Tax=Microtetraspora sp. NBRC 13810 TaxID=3030990 RepID=UPI0024A04FB7|nr:hypothetical protein [Microtetraspora sp. NBRC 13810]GLW13092.1 hypothetical protein Misp01_82200 [Microtetraspora sp. NBRC 13810]